MTDAQKYLVVATCVVSIGFLIGIKFVYDATHEVTKEAATGAPVDINAEQKMEPKAEEPHGLRITNETVVGALLWCAAQTGKSSEHAPNDKYATCTAVLDELRALVPGRLCYMPEALVDPAGCEIVSFQP